MNFAAFEGDRALIDLRKLTNEEMVRHVTSMESVTELENELAQRLELLLLETEPDPIEKDVLWELPRKDE